MLKSFNGKGQLRDPNLIVRILLGTLLAANLIAAGLVLFPPGGSAEELDRQYASLQSQLRAKQALVERTREHAGAVETGRGEGDKFLSEYFLPDRRAFEALLSELDAAAGNTKIKPREHAYSTEPVEGSDSLSMMTITAAYEGTYADLMHFVHEIDKSPRLLIIESLNAAPQAGTNLLSVSMKLDTFVREGEQ